MLKYLTLARSPLSNFHGSYPHLTALDLSRTNLTEFDSNTMYLPKLEHLKLDGTPIKRLTLVGVMSQLRHMSIKNTSLTEFNTSDFKTPMLGVLFLDKTPIQNVDFTKGIESVRILHMRYTALTGFVADNFNLSKLEFLNFGGTLLSRVYTCDFLDDFPDDFCRLLKSHGKMVKSHV